NVVYSCKYHVVWCPKYRRKVLTNGVDTRLKELLTEYATNLSVEILEMEIMPDHVHMLLEVDPQFGIQKAVKSFKGYTSRILRQEFPYLKTKMPLLLSDDDYSLSDAPGSELYTNKPVHFSALPEIFLTPDSHGLVSVPSPPASM
ncbi:IS200/IS605 family transposase, partial [Fusicatenibacter saccharivorans]